jgi:hypothetical protein
MKEDEEEEAGDRAPPPTAPRTAPVRGREGEGEDGAACNRREELRKRVLPGISISLSPDTGLGKPHVKG